MYYSLVLVRLLTLFHLPVDLLNCVLWVFFPICTSVDTILLDGERAFSYFESVFGPLLFCLYVNDSNHVLDKGRIKHIIYADDLQGHVQFPLEQIYFCLSRLIKQYVTGLSSLPPYKW